MSHDAPTVSARFVYGSTSTHDGSATIHHGVATNSHDASTIRYGASTIQAGSATVASRPPTDVHDLVTVCQTMTPNINISSTFDEVSHGIKDEKLWQNQNSHRTHRLGSVLPQLQWHVQLYQITSSSSCKGPRTVSYSICPNFDSLWLA